MSRSILMLGGSHQQVVAIEAAKRLGYRTVLCDYLPDNPGQYAADVFYQVSTTDKEAVLKVAENEQIEGVLAYASDPASPVAAYVAERLNLPTNPLWAVETMSEKHLFRRHLEEHRFPHPRSHEFSAEDEFGKAWEAIRDLKRPIVVKPTDSSGSKGVSIVESQEEFVKAAAVARKISRNGILIAEEYIEKTYPHVIGGDVFVVDGKIRFWGLMDCVRDENVALVPTGKMAPAGLSQQQSIKVKETLQGLVESLDIQFGELNVEVMLGEDDVPYVLELGSRAGGNMIPVQLSDISGLDLVAANVHCAMGEDPQAIDFDRTDAAYATHVLHTLQHGIYDSIEIDDALAQNVYRMVFYVQKGDEVEPFIGAGEALGIVFMKFDSQQQMRDRISKISDHIHISLT